MSVKFIDAKTGLVIPKPSSLFIDKIAVTIPVHPAHQANVVKIFKEQLCGNWGAKKYGFHTSLYQNAIKIPFGPYDKDCLLFQCAPWNPQNNFVRVEYNPSKVDINEVKVLLNMILPGGYKSLLHTGVIRRVDIATDLSFVKPSDMVFHYPGIQCSGNYFKGGRIQSAYLGEKESQRQIVIYDKVAHLKKLNSKLPSDIKFPIPNHDVTRVEIRLRPNGIEFHQLFVLDNPFHKLQLCVCSDSGKGDDEWRLFRSLCIYEGVNQAIKCFDNITKRKKYLERIMTTGLHKFWNPGKLWLGLPNALEEAGFSVNSILSSICGEVA